MTSANPPSIITNTYNPSFFTTTSGLTQSQANVLYLQKTTPDTASALETFNSGITTNGLTMGGSNNITLGNGSVIPTSLQLGYTIRNLLLTTVNLAQNNSGGVQLITSFTLPIGIWQCSYQVRYANQTGTTNVTISNIIMFIATPESNTPNNYGWVSNSASQTIISTNTISVSSSSTIVNKTSQTLYLYDISTYTGTTILTVYGSPNPQCFLMAVRIA